MFMMEEELTVDVKTLSSWLSTKKAVTILDVRPLQEREEWSIPGSTHLDVYTKLKANEDDVFKDSQLSKNIPIVTVCAGGRMSLVAARQLKQQGYTVYSLEGGMKAWNYAWNTATVSFENVKVIQVRRSAKGCLSYLVGSGDEAVVIDASLDPEVYLNLAIDNGWKIRYVMDTHIHADYISRTRELAVSSGAAHLMIDVATVDYSFSPIKDGDVISFGNRQMNVVHTPGHTWESTSYQLGNDVIFTGDTLFTDGVGRPDLKADHEESIKKSKQLYQSLQRLTSLPEAILVLPAHISAAVPFDTTLITGTMGALRKMELITLNEEKFIDYTLSRIPPTPPNYLTIARLNKITSTEDYQRADLEAGPNRCAIA